MIASGTIIALLAFAAWRDFATRTIPDGVSIAMIAVGVLNRLHDGWQSLSVSIGVALILFLMLIPLQARGLLGGADLKLLSALAFGLPPLETYYLVLIVAVFGAALAVVYLGLRFALARIRTVSGPVKRHCGTVSRIAAIETWRIRKGAPLPYGIAIAAGVVFTTFAHFGV